MLDRTWDGRLPAVCPPHIHIHHSLLSMLYWPEDTVFFIELWQETCHYPGLSKGYVKMTGTDDK